VLDSAVVHRPKTLGRDCIPVQRGVVAGEVVQDGFHAKAWGEARVHDLLPNHLTPEMTWTARTVRENCKARLCKTSDLVTTAGETAGDSAEDDGCGVGDGDGERESSQADPDAGNAGGTEDGWQDACSDLATACLVLMRPIAYQSRARDIIYLVAYNCCALLDDSFCLTNNSKSQSCPETRSTSGDDVSGSWVYAKTQQPD
jgi:hypothetical protein